MKSHLWAVLIALAAIGPAVAVAPTDLALGAGADPTSSVSPSPSASPSPSPSASASVSAKAPANSNLVPTPPRTNLVAVVDPIAVPVRDGVLIRVGARNSGPRSITAPAGQSAVSLTLVFSSCCSLIFRVRSLGGCQIGYLYPPSWPEFPAEPRFINCSSGRTLRVGQTYWQSFVFPDLSSLASGVELRVSGYAEEPDDLDNRRKVVVRLAEPGSTLPVTGIRTFSVAGAGLALVFAGTMAIWYGRRRRPVQPTGSVQTFRDEGTS